jgi:two-component system chemotaxis response regulator CheB
MMRVLVVDDSAIHRLSLSAALRELPLVREVEAAASGEEAIRLLASSRFDLMTLDVVMPGMDGFAVLRWVMANRPLPILVVSDAQGDRTAVEALELGAFDVLRKASPRSGGLEAWKALLARAVEGAAQLKLGALESRAKSGAHVALTKRRPRETPHRKVLAAMEQGRSLALVVVSSTGGPAALRDLFTDLAPRQIVVGVAQHMPPPFTKTLAARLASTTGWNAREAQDGEELVPGTIHLAPGGHHLELESSDGKVFARVTPGGSSTRWCPSGDLLLASAARIFGPRTVGVVLTGMGNDGEEGARVLAAAGGMLIAESRETAVITGMPESAARAVPGALRLPLPAIARELERRFALATLPAPS